MSKSKKKQSNKGWFGLPKTARGDSNRDFLAGLLIFILFGATATATVVGTKNGSIPNLLNPNIAPPAGAPHENVTLTLAQSKGINWQLTKWQTSSKPGQAPDGYNWAGIESDVKDMQGAGISWARFTLNSDNTVNDKLIKLLADHDIRILAIIPANPPKTKGNFIQRLIYRDALKKTVVHFGNKVQYYEVENEPNNPAFWNIDSSEKSDQKKYEQSVSDYIDHLKESTTAIRTGNPSAIIFLGGLNDSTATRWLDVFIAKNGYTYVDGVSYHIQASNPIEIGQKVHALKVELAKVADFAVKPLWITDIGFTTDSKDTSVAKVLDEKTKADYVLQTFAAIRSEGMYGPIFWTKLEEAKNDLPGYGLIMKNSTNLQTTYLPAYDMLKSF